MPFHQREILHTLINHPELDIATFNSVAMLSALIQHLKTVGEKLEAHIDPTVFASLGLAMADRYNDTLKEMASELRSALANTEAKLGEYLQAADEDKKVTRAAFLESHHELNQQFNKAIKHLNALQLKVKSGGYYKNAKTLVSLIKQGKVVSLFDLDAFSAASKMLKVTRVLGAGFIVVDLAEVTYDTTESYQQGGDWKSTLTEKAIEIGAGIAGGALIWTVVEFYGMPILAFVAYVHC